MKTIIKSLVASFIAMFLGFTTLFAVTSDKTNEDAALDQTFESPSHNFTLVRSDNINAGLVYRQDVPILFKTIDLNTIVSVRDVTHEDMYIPSFVLCKDDQNRLVLLIKTEYGFAVLQVFDKEREMNLWKVPSTIYVALATSIKLEPHIVTAKKIK